MNGQNHHLAQCLSGTVPEDPMQREVGVPPDDVLYAVNVATHNPRGHVAKADVPPLDYVLKVGRNLGAQ